MQQTTTTAPACNAGKKRIRRTPEERLHQLQARAEMLEAKLREKRRRAETRDKIILGGWVRALCRADADQVRIMDYLGRMATSRKIPIPKNLQGETETAMRRAAAAKTKQQQSNNQK